MSTCPSHFALFESIDIHIRSSDIRSSIVLADGSSGPVAVADVRAILSNPDTSVEASDAVWSELIIRARMQRDPWQLVAIWAMTSGLRAASWRLSQHGRVDYADAQSEIVLGFLEALRTIDVDASRLGRTLWRAASSHGWRTCRRSSREFSVRDPETVSVRVTDRDRAHGSGGAELCRETATAEHVDEGRLEGERLGSLAARAGLCDRARRRQAVEPIDSVVRYIRLGERGIRPGPPRTRVARQAHDSCTRRHDNRDGGLR
ncbi:hypothetical protein [Catenulispora sp. GP43]|uniref:hypothetical protein n=1 Tax=Catenulispora sp. GP43 TaxID=3156263 RepID=UPI003516E1A1